MFIRAALHSITNHHKKSTFVEKMLFKTQLKRGLYKSNSSYVLFCKRKAFKTTDNELNDIATAANIGVSNNPVKG